MINLKNAADIEFHKDHNLRSFSTLKLEAAGDLYIVKTEAALIELLPTLKEFRLLGLGANQVLPKTSTIPYIKLNFDFNKALLSEVQNEYYLPASVTLGQLTAHAVKFGLKGWETFTGIPATIGGAIAMNAGTGLGEIGEIVKKVIYIDKDFQRIEKVIKPGDFKYRGNNFLTSSDVVIGAVLVHNGQDSKVSTLIKDYLKMRNATQPLWDKTCGCIFKNYNQTCRAGLFIDIIGLKGFTLNNVQISHKHGNFFVNKGGATIDDFINIIKVVQDELYLQFGIRFEEEVKLL